MQELVGTRTAADINLAAQVLILAGLLVGFWLARKKRFGHHANVQTTMVLTNLVLIAVIMATSFYDYVIAGETTTGRVAQWMILHGIVGALAELMGLYLILRMRTKVIPKRFRVRNIKLAMRATLALWTALVALGLGIYYERYLVEETAAATAPLIEFRQLGADLYVHAVELEDAVARGSLTAIYRHAEHLINLIEGETGLHYGDNDADGHLEDPGDGQGLLARLDQVVAAADDDAVLALAETVRVDLDRIVALSVALLGAGSVDEAVGPVAQIVDLARDANGQGVFRIDQAARVAGVIEAPVIEIAAASDGTVGAGTITIREDQFLFLPDALTIPAGTTVVWVNDERAKHTATADDERFDSGDQSLGDEYAYTFAEPGVYPYFCRYHGDVGGVGMAGVIVVEDE